MNPSPNPSTTPITIEANIAAPAAKVWAAWTDPAHITKWNFASDDWCCPSASNDLRVGGKYTARMEAKDGSFGFDFEAIYDEVTPEKSMTYTMPDGRVVTTTFEEAGGTTTVKTVFDAESENPVEVQRDGWQAILNSFKRYAEAS
ncbi:SRPBCC family protein [Kordiimonas sp.]|uniref:SRPBCC family protein n=1 Tax=Kordiimonas sp. TaxID=1970157 RepID=UPI003A8F0A99